MEEPYSCVFLRWCVGYLNHNELRELLVKLANHLQKDSKVKTRGAEPTSYIVILDNVTPPGQTWGPFAGQYVHCEDYYEKVFKSAGLKVRQKTKETYLHNSYRPVVAWALA